MIGLIITGHGHFASGLLSAAEVIAGKQDHVAGVDFLSGDSSEGLREKLEQAAKGMRCESVIFMTDIAGGTPFNQSVLLSGKADYASRVFSGSNMPLLLEAIFGRASGDLNELTQALLGSEQAKVQLYAERKKTKAQETGGI